jgi:hypothetical protein
MGSCVSDEDVVDEKGMDVLVHEALCKSIQASRPNGKSNGDMIITCEPNTQFLARSDFLILKKDNPNFISIYNNLGRNNIYSFKFDHNNYVLSVDEPLVHKYVGKVLNFLDLSKQYKHLDPLHQLLLDPEMPTRVIVTDEQKTQLVCGQLYRLFYKKYRVDDLYLVIDFTKLE